MVCIVIMDNKQSDFFTKLNRAVDIMAVQLVIGALLNSRDLLLLCV